jgi:hypothetical protein
MIAIITITLSSLKRLYQCQSELIQGQRYEYGKPYPGICVLDTKGPNKGKLVLRCTKCNANNLNNACECSPQQYLMHKDSEMIRHALKEPDTPDFIKKFKEAKDCTPQEYRSHMKLNEYDYRKGKTDADHRISPNDKTKPSEFWFDLTNERHRDFIFHFKNNELIPTSVNQHKGSSNNLDELKIIFEEFAKQTPAGDIHDILIAMRERRNVTEVAHIAEVVAVKKEVDEETIKVKRFVFEGNTYLISAQSGLIYDEFTKDEIGEWNATSKSIDFYETDDEEEEDVVVEKEKELDPNEKYLMELSEISTSKNSLIINMRSVIFEAEKRKHEKKANKCEHSVKRRDKAIIQCEQLIQKYKVQNTHLIEQKNKSVQLINHLHNLINTH